MLKMIIFAILATAAVVLGQKPCDRYFVNIR